jgi:hypothetical protein
MGRVNAVNRVFIGAVAAVVIGGAGTVTVAVLRSRWFPELRTERKLDGRS